MSTATQTERAMNMSAPSLTAVNAGAAVAPTATKARDAAFDFTKGILVLFMVFYHWMNYFIPLRAEYYTYLLFLTPSFIFITGYMISHIHFQKYGIANLRLPGRLLVRGLKLLAVFVGLNALIGLALPGSLVRRSIVGGSIPARLFSVFVVGNVSVDQSGKSAAFMILVPISYLLIVSALIILAGRRLKYPFHIAFGLIVLAVCVLRGLGVRTFNLELLMVGILGVVLGYAKKNQVAALVSRPYILSGLYVVYLIAITIWYVILPVQTVGAVLTTALIYMVGGSLAGPGMFGRMAVLVGQYSLFGYISQIAILQVLRRISWFHRNGVIGLSGSLLLGFVLTIGFIELLESVRARSALVNRLYQLVFA